MLVWDKTLEDVANPSSYAVYIVGGRFRDYELFNRLAVHTDEYPNRGIGRKGGSGPTAGFCVSRILDPSSLYLDSLRGDDL